MCLIIIISHNPATFGCILTDMPVFLFSHRTILLFVSNPLKNTRSYEKTKQKQSPANKT